ncbi:hypothetical protein MKW98_006664 [Papaver atlanticum]|uniref:Lysosomal Pro-X carboxypeptidase n=1 Tax=Papaver atlanticum TaxID=357466 RepID=A0AAD4T047_9MAGN|nr:hypothetical protein MKW98_006664 [Papaver atlanticum]
MLRFITTNTQKNPILLCLSLGVLFLSICISGTTPRLGAIGRKYGRSTALSSDDYKEFFYTQTLDHFNYRPESYETFQQKYVINFKYWGGATVSAPIFVSSGAEASIDGDVAGIGFLSDSAPQFKALIVFIEHRYYGESIPFGSTEEAFRNASTLGYFSSSQALADYAEVIISLKKNLSADSSPVIVFGASYGGMLASWFRLKYPHIAHGALASSAPVLYFDDAAPEYGYYSIVSKDYRFCYDVIKQSWSVIDSVASDENGLAILSQKFKTCSYPVTRICNAIDGAPRGSDILSRIQLGVAAYEGELNCYDMGEFSRQTETDQGWRWQTCSEMVMPIGDDGKDTMFQASPFDLKNFSRSCRSRYNVEPRPHWILNEFGGKDIKLVLRQFASNIIYSNGLRDPYSSGGVLESISDNVVAITTVKGSHCLDLLPASSDDPKWLVEQREAEIQITKTWIDEYNVLRMIENENGDKLSSCIRATIYICKSSEIFIMVP